MFYTQKLDLPTHDTSHQKNNYVNLIQKLGEIGKFLWNKK